MAWPSRGYYTISVPRRGLRFSEIEKRQIAISVLLLTLAFGIAWEGLRGAILFPIAFAQVLAVSLIAVITGFLFHELAHKAVAQRYGCWSEYRYSMMGLMLALFFSFFGFVFAAPGAVVVSGYVNKEQNGKISLAGPTTNLVLGAIFLSAASFTTIFWLHEALWRISFINVFLGGFNLIPIPPFDGSKVWPWSIPAYIIALIVTFFLLYLVWPW